MQRMGSIPLMQHPHRHNVSILTQMHMQTLTLVWIKLQTADSD